MRTLGRCAFTLIELLVVIAIISLLVSILLPSLSKAKQLAEGVMCLSNLKNWGTAAQMYCNDFSGDYVYTADLSASPNKMWHDYLSPYIDAEDPNNPGYMMNRLSYDKKNMHRCPTKSEFSPSADAHLPDDPDYQMNFALGPYRNSDGTSSWVKYPGTGSWQYAGNQDNVVDTSDTLYMIDGKSGFRGSIGVIGRTIPANASPITSVDYRHGGGDRINVLFAGGSACSMAKSDAGMWLDVSYDQTPGYGPYAPLWEKP